MRVKSLVVLEAIRKTKSTVPLPITGSWTPLKEELKSLFQEGLLEIKGNEFVISADGKKAILIFNDTRKELIEPFEGFKRFRVNGETIDGRIPLASFSVKNKLENEICADYLQNLNTFLVWEDFFEYIKNLKKEGAQWQATLLDAFKYHANYGVEIDAWKRLGKDDTAALITGAKILMPDKLIQITL